MPKPAIFNLGGKPVVNRGTQNKKNLKIITFKDNFRFRCKNFDLGYTGGVHFDLVQALNT
jgi:hypothetical protein